MNKRWKEFQALSEKCYVSMIQGKTEIGTWNQAFSVLMEIMADERKKNPDFAPELYLVDDVTDYRYDVDGWLEDYLDELEVKEEYESLQEVCGRLLELFLWEDDKPSDLKFRMASALGEQGRKQEALDFCETWYREDTEDVIAAAALIYARIGIGDHAGAEQIVEHFISEDTVCTDENDIIFIAAGKAYEANGNEKAWRRVDQALEKYDKELEKLFEEMDDDTDFDWSEEELPFN